MGSKAESKVPVIFGKIKSDQLHMILEGNDAKNKATKAVFLIREDEKLQGFMTVSYYSQEHDMVKNIRFGLTKEGWKVAPRPPREPAFTDTLEVKEKYLHDKARFDKEMQGFINTAGILFEQNASCELIKMLTQELKEKFEFDLSGLIRPSETQASKEKHFSDYVGDVFITDSVLGLSSVNNL
ncbi:hypothetical protein OQJ18_05720 [Fluoribacter dumoffii]|uniref:Uncharacterized protein n=1 Tax=Fluoribacter dumoffii TaxID=463 RepID=A0A377G9K1_9GAMM|nr:hypothetical protein [Fluoribacter dumoffii]KTC90063.1 hypothetical protein Ldum_1131 [Fluoribacter dumoffii NY 23]MCW8385362.1 hypothetical protein [Fluoribacter dumoffii]MCW8418415.1 hypothetical protein [Fluoribacter dumoffii]MCW8453743.1 hypothetical protein [Fluoribacter dumoffii]MCW8462186.1 hypothetical protein [Fluoribacter dumoffii]